MQLELFEKLSPSPCEEGLECNNCGIVQPVDNFEQLAAGEIKRKCRTCKRNQSGLIRHLKTLHCYPDDNYCCPICDRDIKELSRTGQKMLQSWVLDHCHDTETFRAWVCFNCNTGLGAFKDSLERVTKAKIYLEDHIQKQKEK
tara:strand:- start:2 stop:430 length:429 start_codon:yes stop_codon:yes gene_type:complete